MIKQFAYGNGHAYVQTLTESQLPLRILASKGTNKPLDLTYTYDKRHLITRIDDASPNNHDLVLGYDGLEQITSATGSWGTGEFKYDSLGNVRYKRLGGRSVTVNYNTKYQVTSSVDIGNVGGNTGTRNFSHDHRGNVTQSGNISFIYDYADQPISIGGAKLGSYVYDGNLKRVQSTIDAMTFWANGFRNVTTAYGTNGFTEEIKNALINNQVKRVLIAYDRDDAGNIAAEKLAEELKLHQIDCYRILFPKGMDANEYALQMTPANKALGLVIRKAEPMIKAKKRNDDNQLSEKIVDKEKEISPLAAVIPEPTAAVQPKVMDEVDAQINDREIKMAFGDRHYRVRDLNKNLTYDQLKVNVMANKGDLLHVDTLELYNAKQRQTFIKIASSELGVEFDVIKKDLGKVLLKLEALQDDQIEKNLAPVNKVIELAESEKSEALALLKDKNLLQRILSDFNECGVVGEETNKPQIGLSDRQRIPLNVS